MTYFVSSGTLNCMHSLTLMLRLHQDICCWIHLYPLVAVNMFVVSATKLSPVCCPSVARYVDREIVIISPRCSQHVSRTSNTYPATCVRRHIIRIRIQVARPRYSISWRHVSWCKRGIGLGLTAIRRGFELYECLLVYLCSEICCWRWDDDNVY